jgi:hypothetical protein
MKFKAATTVGVLSTFLVVASTGSAPAKTGCSNATLRGSYGIEASGSFLTGSLTGPIAIVGVLTYDGLGNVSGHLTQRVTTSTGPTTLSNVPFSGVYSVNADCTAEDVLTNLSNGTTGTHEYAIVSGGRAFSTVNTSTGPAVVIGRGRKQFTTDNDPG